MSFIKFQTGPHTCDYYSSNDCRIEIVYIDDAYYVLINTKRKSRHHTMNSAMQYVENAIKNQIHSSQMETTQTTSDMIIKKMDELIECIKYLPTVQIAGSEFKTAQASAMERGFKP